MKKFPASLLAAACALALPSCETTGDPTEGGLFGWSSQKFDQRVADKERTLNTINRDTYYQNQRADGLRSNIRHEQRALRRYE